jgi:predicted DNA-binding helix-hairpin-helix protein
VTSWEFYPDGAPGASEELMKEAGLYADRMSINLEMPTETCLKLLAPEKSHMEGVFQKHQHPGP